MSKFITTKVGRTKIAQAHKDGTALPKFDKIGWGEGGVDEEDNVLQPSELAPEVPDEFTKTDITSIVLSTTEDDVILMIIGEVDGEVVGEEKQVSSCGIYDDQDDLIAIINFARKPLDVETVLEAKWTAKY